MSEFAQRRLEQLLPIFDELQRVRLFTNEDVKRIVKKCKSFEHKLEKRVKVKDDFIKYAQYLIYLLSLIRERRIEMKCVFKRKEIDHALARKIDTIFKSACFRFQADIGLWLSRIEFSKSQHLYVSVSRIYMRMLQVHTDKPHIWIAAAKWEFEGNGSAESARKLLQRGLRFNSDSERMYLELFRLELLYVHKIKKRLVSVQSSGGQAQERDVDVDEVSDVVLEGELARLVFEEATKTFQGNVGLCVRFAKIAQEYQFAGKLVDYVYEHIDQHYENCEERWDAVAQREYFKTKNIELCCRVFDRATAQLNTGKMWQMYLRFLLERLDETGADRDHIRKLCLAVFGKATKNHGHTLDEDLYKDWLDLCQNQKLLGEIVDMSLKQYPKSASLWRYCLKWKIANGAEEKVILTLFNQAVCSLPEKETPPLWQLALNWAVQICPDRVEDLLKASLIFDPIVSDPMKIDYLEWTLLNRGIDATRALFRQLCDQKPNNLEFYMVYISMEREQLHLDVDAVRHCFEQALFEHGRMSVEVWLKYVEFELKHPRGDPARILEIYSRAIRGLANDNVEDFMREYLLLTKG